VRTIPDVYLPGGDGGLLGLDISPRFARDNLVYVFFTAVGDGHLGGSSQDLANLNVKILRITPTGRPAPGNPFPRSPRRRSTSPGSTAGCGPWRSHRTDRCGSPRRTIRASRARVTTAFCGGANPAE